jgi:serine/threonine protein kinase
LSEKLICPRCRAEYPGDQQWCAEDGAALCEPEDIARLGTCFANYEIESVLGVGGMGVVYKGVHTALKKTFAIKVLNEYYGKRKGAYQEMLREAQAASRIRHEHIVDVSDFGTTEDGAAYLVMEYLRGESLAETMAKHGRVSIPWAVEVVRQVASALHAAHGKSIVHRDLKPENVFLSERAEGAEIGEELLTVKLLDFGLAKVQDMGPSTRTRAGIIAGTPLYMSPEQARNESVDARSDIYSLGVLFYYMVTGTLPFVGSSMVEIMMGHIAKEVASPRSRCAAVDLGTNAVILRCMRKDPADRYQSAVELFKDLPRCGDKQLPRGGLLKLREAASVKPSLVDTEMLGSAAAVSKTREPLPASDMPAGATVSAELVDNLLDGVGESGESGFGSRKAKPVIGAASAESQKGAHTAGAAEPDEPQPPPTVEVSNDLLDSLRSHSRSAPDAPEAKPPSASGAAPAWQLSADPELRPLSREADDEAVEPDDGAVESEQAVVEASSDPSTSTEADEPAIEAAEPSTALVERFTERAPATEQPSTRRRGRYVIGAVMGRACGGGRSDRVIRIADTIGQRAAVISSTVCLARRLLVDESSSAGGERECRGDEQAAAHSTARGQAAPTIAKGGAETRRAHQAIAR